jgi:hypothetical protein
MWYNDDEDLDDLLDVRNDRHLNYFLDEIDPNFHDNLHGERRNIHYTYENRDYGRFVDGVIDDDFIIGNYSSIEARRAGYNVDSTSVPAHWSNDNAIDFLNLGYRNIHISEKVFDRYLEYVGTRSKEHEHPYYLDDPVGFEDYIRDLFNKVRKREKLGLSPKESLNEALEDIYKSTLSEDPLEDKMNKIRRRLGSSLDKSSDMNGKTTDDHVKKAKIRIDIARECMLAKYAKQSGKP